MKDTRLMGLAALAGVALVTVIGVGAVIGAGSVAASLRPTANATLAAAGLSSVEVDVQGREVTLAGGSASELAAAQVLLESVPGVRSVSINQVTPAIPRPDARGSVPSLRFEVVAGGPQISGVVADAETAANLKATAASTFGGVVRGDLTVNPGASPADWPTGMPDAFADLAGIKALAIEIDESSGSIVIGGRIESQAGVDRVVRLVAADLPDLTVDSRVVVSPAGLGVDDAEALNIAAVYFASGSATPGTSGMQTVEAVAAILLRNTGLTIAVVGRAGPSDRVEGRTLSDGRVANVKALLVKRGVAAERIGTLSHGSVRVATSAPHARQYRRVDFVVKEG